MQMSLEMESMVAEIISAFLARKQGQESQTGKEGGDRGGEGEESVLGKKKTVASTFQSELMCGFVEKCLENDVLHDEWKKHIHIHSSQYTMIIWNDDDGGWFCSIGKVVV